MQLKLLFIMIAFGFVLPACEGRKRRPISVEEKKTGRDSNQSPDGTPFGNPFNNDDNPQGFSPDEEEEGTPQGPGGGGLGDTPESPGGGNPGGTPQGPGSGGGGQGGTPQAPNPGGTDIDIEPSFDGDAPPAPGGGDNEQGASFETWDGTSSKSYIDGFEVKVVE